MRRTDTQVQLLLNYNAQANFKDAKDKMPLQYALDGNFDILNREVFDLLFEKQADPNIHFSNGETPLFYAAKNKDFQLLYKLIEYGADINMPNEDGSTLLSSAVVFPDEVAVPTVSFLLDQGANPQSVDHLYPSDEVKELLDRAA